MVNMFYLRCFYAEPTYLSAHLSLWPHQTFIQHTCKDLGDLFQYSMLWFSLFSQQQLTILTLVMGFSGNDKIYGRYISLKVWYHHNQHDTVLCSEQVGYKYILMIFEQQLFYVYVWLYYEISYTNFWHSPNL